MENVCNNINKLLENIKQYSKKARLMAVSKTFPYEKVKEAYNCGQRLFGENRVQEAIEKIELSKEDHLDIEWHLIGHLQKNKAKKAVLYFDCIESIDSLELAKRVDRYAKEFDKTLSIMLEVNVAKEPQKYGFLEDELFNSMDEILKLKNVDIIGLMCVAPVAEDANEIAWVFKRLRDIKDAINDKYKTNIQELSMGMSNDYKVALKEGSTIIRIGRGIFGERNYIK